jgi:hypothetical protein
MVDKDTGVSNLKAYKLFITQIEKNLTFLNNSFITFYLFNYTIIYEIYTEGPNEVGMKLFIIFYLFINFCK